MDARRALAAYLICALVLYAGVAAYKDHEARARLPAPEPAAVIDVRVVDAPPARALEAMSDIGSWQRIGGVESARPVPGSDPPAVEVELREWLVPLTVRAEHEVGPGWQQLRVVGGYLDGATVTQRFEPDGGLTRITTTAELDLRALRMVSGAPEEFVRDRLEAAVSELARPAASG